MSSWRVRFGDQRVLLLSVPTLELSLASQCVALRRTRFVVDELHGPSAGRVAGAATRVVDVDALMRIFAVPVYSDPSAQRTM